MFNPKIIEIIGPLAVHMEGFYAILLSLSNAPSSVRKHLYVLAHLSRWLDQQKIQPSDLTAWRQLQISSPGRYECCWPPENSGEPDGLVDKTDVGLFDLREGLLKFPLDFHTPFNSDFDTYSRYFREAA